jgi:hypothetical protein
MPIRKITPNEESTDVARDVRGGGTIYVPKREAITESFMSCTARHTF